MDVSPRGTHVITRGPGEFFGEIALICDTPRTATVRAGEAVQLVVVDRAAFLDSIGAHPRCTHAAHTVVDARVLTGGRGRGRLRRVAESPIQLADGVTLRPWPDRPIFGMSVVAGGTLRIRWWAPGRPGS